METETQTAEEATTPKSYRSRGENAGAGHVIVLGPRDSLVGKLTVEGEVRVQGKIEGELKAGGDVHVEGSATVSAPIEARNVTVRGQVNGDVTASEKLMLAGSGVLSGNVKVARLTIEDGATLNGNVTMSREGHGRHGKGESNHQEAPAEGG